MPATACKAKWSEPLHCQRPLNTAFGLRKNNPLYTKNNNTDAHKLFATTGSTFRIKRMEAKVKHY